jgi:hypothetical protein
MRYLASLCCDADEDDSRHLDGGSVNLQNLESTPLSTPVLAATVVERPRGGDEYQPVTTFHHDDDDDDGPENDPPTFEDEGDDAEEQEHCCCRHHHDDRTNNDGASSAMALHEHGLHEFFRTLRERWRRRDTFRQLPPTNKEKEKSKKYTAGLSPLRTALSYDTSHCDFPTISLDEVVLPGSELQKQMALEASRRLEEHTDECVICMDGFDPTNPRMPTLCGCGENKTYFHLPCLYQWIDQNEESTCPVCKQPLTWDEF